MKFAAKRTIWQLLGLLAIPFAIVPMILGPITKCLSFDSWNNLITVALGVGIGLELLYFLLPQVEVLSVLPVGGYGAGMALLLITGAPVIADELRQINWVNGNFLAVVICLACMLLACVLLVIRAYKNK